MARVTDQLIRSDFPTFARECHKVCRNGETLDPDPYLTPVFAFAEQIAEGTTKRAIVNLPPGTAKSFIFGACLPAWVLAHDPAAAVMIVGHGKRNPKDNSRKILQILSSTFYQHNFSTKLNLRWKGAGDFGTTQGGCVYATSIRGSITGFRADLIVVDDPLSIKNADNQDEINFVNNTFDTELFSRLRNKQSRIVVVMHRLNDNDLTAQLMRKTS